MTKIKVGQVWQENNGNNSYPGGVRMVIVEGTGGSTVQVRCLQSNRRSWVRFSRFGSRRTTGFTLIRDIEESEAAE